MSHLTEVARRVLFWVYRVLPKFDIAVLWGWPDYEDNIVALESALRETQVRRTVLLLTDRRAEPPVALGPRTIRVTKESPIGWLWFLFARHVFFTHRCYMRRFPPNVVAVNVWHGMPLKRIGHLSPGDDVIEARHTLATSPLWADVMARSMDSTAGVLTTGLPRNDRLFTDPAPVRHALDLGSDERLVFWLPTYRRSVRGRPMVDGRPTDTSFEFDIDVPRLDRFLREHRAQLLVKPHPLSATANPVVADTIRIVNDEWLRARGVTLYAALGATDVLVSDVSSVTIDFLLLDRPLIHAISDLDEYETTRGFSVDAIEDVLGGPVATSQDALETALATALVDGPRPDDRRREVLARSHTHRDARSTERLLRVLNLREATEP